MLFRSGTQVQVFAVAEYLRSIGTDLDVLRLMLRAAANQMNYLSNDDAIALNIRVWDEKRDQVVEPELVKNSLDRSHTVSSASNPTASSETGSASTAAPRPVSKAEGSAKSPS